MNKQLTLGIKLNEEASFAEYFWGPNAIIQQQLQQLLTRQGERYIYLWGTPASGKSHLLQACCQAFSSQESAIYLPLEDLLEWGADSLSGLEQQGCIALDDIETIAGKAQWEEALFHLYNRLRQQQDSLLIISGSLPPSQLPLQLADLRSRLAWGLILQVHEIDDDAKIKVLCQWAKQRGIDLAPAIAHFLVHRCSRSLHTLKGLLDKIDSASLTEKRKITLPFVKKTLLI